jgi:translocation and assembly module TamA
MAFFDSRFVMKWLCGCGFFLLWAMICAPVAQAQSADLLSFEGNMPKDVLTLVGKASEQILNTARVDDKGDEEQLFRRLRPIVRDVLGTQGYFSPVIERKVEETSDPEAPLRLVMTVDVCEQSHIASVEVDFEGEINSPEFDTRRAQLRADWLLVKGDVFKQGRWAANKESILSDLLARDFADATLADSIAEVDPDAKTVRLKVLYDSGPVFTFGKLDITGLSKFRSDLVERFSTIKPGDRYEQERLLTLLADLQNTSYFSSVDVKIDKDAQSPKLVPIHVSVLESKSKRIGFGGGYSSNTGFRTEVSYQYNNLFNHAYSLTTGVRLEQKRQSAFADLFLPPTHKGVVDALGVSFDHQNLSGLDLNRNSVGVRREYTLGHTSFQLGLNFQVEERQTPIFDLGSTQALVAGASVTHNRVDDRLNPTQGYVAFGQVAAASSSLLSDQDFLRLYGRVQKFWSPSRKNLYTARFELGSVFADSSQNIPQDYLFRAGGTNSVRGFEFLDIGVLDHGVLVGGRRLMIGSLEYTRWLDGPVGVAVFTDVGDVSNSWSDFKPKPAVGVGLRYKTAAGPISFDVAKAKDQDRVRIHFALGVAF